MGPNGASPDLSQAKKPSPRPSFYTDACPDLPDGEAAAPNGQLHRMYIRQLDGFLQARQVQGASSI